MIQSVLAEGAAAAEHRGFLSDPLFPAEVAFISKAVDQRQREFQTVRACARIALAQLGLERPPMVPGPHGEPRWPKGVVGSMTHCASYAAAVVMRSDYVRGLGVDAEPHASLSEGVFELVAAPEGPGSLTELAKLQPGIHWDRVLFSAKESIYKALFPIVQRWIGFEDVRVTLSPDGDFAGQLLVAKVAGDFNLTEVTGRWTIHDDVIVTAVTLPSAGRIAPSVACR